MRQGKGYTYGSLAGSCVLGPLSYAGAVFSMHASPSRPYLVPFGHRHPHASERLHRFTAWAYGKPPPEENKTERTQTRNRLKKQRKDLPLDSAHYGRSKVRLMVMPMGPYIIQC